ncbi:MAG: phosphoglycerate mutase family protein [Micrococcaceae bacterium]
MTFPNKIFLIRHGESLANIDPNVYEHIPDYRIPLTEKGINQAKEAGKRIREESNGLPFTVYVSPYLRAYQTLDHLGLDDLIERTIEEPRLREQDWANFQNPKEIVKQKKLRDVYGHFFYRFENGESGSDVYDRVSGFLETMYRHFTKEQLHENVLIVTHGLTMRLFCMRYFRWTVEYFESLENPTNAEYRYLEHDKNGHYTLNQPFKQWLSGVQTNHSVYDTFLDKLKEYGADEKDQALTAALDPIDSSYFFGNFNTNDL